MEPTQKKKDSNPDSTEKQPYHPPAISHEIELETKAGSSAGDELPPGLGGG